MPQSLDSLLANIGRAAIHAQNMASKAVSERWLSNCEVDENGVHIPESFKIKIGNQVVDVPYIGLMPPYQTPLDTLEVEIEAEVNFKDMGESDDEIPSVSISAKRGLFRRNSHVKIKATYKMQEPTETQEFLRDELREAVKELYYG